MTISGTIGECPSDDNRQASRNLLRNATREVINQMHGSLFPECGPGSWRRVFYLNVSRSDQSCPGQWNLMITPVRSCAGVAELCHSAFNDGSNTAYSKVCGRIIGEARDTTDAFNRILPGQNTIEENYVDGVSITHGAPGLRTHIWTLGAGIFNHNGIVGLTRPCDISDHVRAPLPPAEVGNNYFCNRADGLDPLWTGESCMNDNPCCSFNSPPYFSVQLPEVTTNSIELRICSDQHQGDKTVLVLFAEIYVQ